jgi:monovalent cation:H+ antiporter-2, CPA2 family
VMVLVLVLLPALAPLLGGAADASHAAADAAQSTAASEPSVWLTLVITLAKVGAFIALMLVVGRRVFPKLL